MPQAQQRVRSVCVYCGSSNLADPAYLEAAHRLGGEIAKAELTFVYGGGGVGLMGASARGAYEAGGKVLGTAKHPLGTTDFASQLLAAQASGISGES